MGVTLALPLRVLGLEDLVVETFIFNSVDRSAAFCDTAVTMVQSLELRLLRPGMPGKRQKTIACADRYSALSDAAFSVALVHRRGRL